MERNPGTISNDRMVNTRTNLITLGDTQVIDWPGTMTVDLFPLVVITVQGTNSWGMVDTLARHTTLGKSLQRITFTKRNSSTVTKEDVQLFRGKLQITFILSYKNILYVLKSRFLSKFLFILLIWFELTVLNLCFFSSVFRCGCLCIWDMF